MNSTSPPTGARPTDEAPTCPRCRHYFITHVVAFPYGCRALGFKSRRLPCEEVLAASGETCAYYSPKPATAAK